MAIETSDLESGVVKNDTEAHAVIVDSIVREYGIGNVVEDTRGVWARKANDQEWALVRPIEK